MASPSDRAGAPIARAFVDDGWICGGPLTPERHDVLCAATALHDADLELIVLAAPDPLGGRDRERLADLAALIGAVLQRRDDLRVLVVGPSTGSLQGLPASRARRVGGPAEALTVARELLPRPWDGREGFVRSIASIAAITDVRVEGVDVGIDAGTRVVADRDGIARRITIVEGGLVPASALDDQALLDRVAWWSPVVDDTYVTRDRLRNLRVAPWRDAAADGARLRLAAARAALQRLDVAWAGPHERRGFAGRPREPVHDVVPITAPDLLIASGGAFAVAPSPAVALALVDTLRAPGAVCLALDHARVLAPLGVLEDESDRRRLLADLVDDVLVPLGGAITAPGLRATHRATLHVTVDGATTSLPVASGTVQVVDLPPGVAASVRLESPDELWVGTRSRNVAFDVTGGLGGLLVDTRDIPLHLPERAERRREVLDAWQQPLWTNAEP